MLSTAVGMTLSNSMHSMFSKGGPSPHDPAPLTTSEAAPSLMRDSTASKASSAPACNLDPAVVMQHAEHPEASPVPGDSAPDAAQYAAGILAELGE